jgi:ketosteroid isomerase-like protein
MTVEFTQQVVDHYFAQMQDGDIADSFADDVTWTIIEEGVVVRGRFAVRDHINDLHGLMADTQTRALAVTDGTAYLEGDCLAAPDATARTAFCLVYDVNGDQITAMRVYGSVESRVGAAPATVPGGPPVDS